ncbi:hypothetical protein DENSPDRAFT_876500 [Dentipellis sp. KUC8613]|nr:hypothetical protein DENSPDRAFT_876500 [Dentipellis sp. KUC8613]
MDPSAAFACSLPDALLSVSPALAALHAVRARRQYHPEPLPAFCARCGSYLFDGHGAFRLSRPSLSRQKDRKRSAQERSAEMSCAACGHTQRTLLPRGNAALFKPVRRRIAPQTSATRPTAAPQPPTDVNIPDTPLTPLTPLSHSPSPSPLPSVASSQPKKSRPKKKSALQEMLARNKEKQERVKSGNTASSGLESFLSTL